MKSTAKALRALQLALIGEKQRHGRDPWLGSSGEPLFSGFWDTSKRW